VAIEMKGVRYSTDPESLGYVRVDSLDNRTKNEVWRWIKQHEPGLAEFLQGPALLLQKEFGGHVELKIDGLSRNGFSPPTPPRDTAT
jgi:hypothetical protein